MGIIASKFAFPVPTNTGRLPNGSRMIKTLDGRHEIPIYIVASAAMLKSRPTVVFSHGNGGCMAYSVPTLERWSQLYNVNVLCYEYIGYPHTTACDSGEFSSLSDNVASPSEENCYMSIATAHHYLTTILGVPESLQIYVGRSIGTGPTTHMVSQLCAAGKKPRQAILISPFYSATHIVSPFLAALYDMFPNHRFVRDITCQLNIIHGDRDGVVPADQSLSLASVCGRNANVHRTVLRNAGHNNLFERRDFECALDRAFKTTQGEMNV